MAHKWRIEYWESKNGDNPIFDFIEKLAFRAQSKISYSFSLLEEYGLELGGHHVKKVKGYDFWELRIIGSDNIRFFYIAAISNTFLLLHGFIKKADKVSRKELKIADKRLNEYKSR